MLVEQNVVDGLSVSRRGYVVENGAVRMEGAAQDLLANEDVRAAYLVPISSDLYRIWQEFQEATAFESSGIT